MNVRIRTRDVLWGLCQNADYGVGLRTSAIADFTGVVRAALERATR